MDSDRKIRQAAKHTEILRAPKQSLFTFGTTNIHYYLLTKPVYSELIKDPAETVIREGRVIAEKPKIVTPYYLSRFEGFSSEARRYFETLAAESGERSSHGLLYSYRNEPKQLTIASDSLPSVVDKLNAEINQRNDLLTAIIKGEDELWDVSLLKFIAEITRSSLSDNLQQLGRRGLLDIDAEGIPFHARVTINDLFERVARGECSSGELKDELERWGLFEEYQDRFFNVIRKKV
ncbi:MAG: hypothetical protein Q8O55_06100 [Dehalococcoidales bacterium]|nr:hypothetical protein [Dehalococcoidales bacterium]